MLNVSLKNHRKLLFLILPRVKIILLFPNSEAYQFLVLVNFLPIFFQNTADWLAHFQESKIIERSFWVSILRDMSLLVQIRGLRLCGGKLSRDIEEIKHSERSEVIGTNIFGSAWHLKNLINRRILLWFISNRIILNHGLELNFQIDRNRTV